MTKGAARILGDMSTVVVGVDVGEEVARSVEGYTRFA